MTQFVLRRLVVPTQAWAHRNADALIPTGVYNLWPEPAVVRSLRSLTWDAHQLRQVLECPTYRLSALWAFPLLVEMLVAFACAYFAPNPYNTEHTP